MSYPFNKENNSENSQDKLYNNTKRYGHNRILNELEQKLKQAGFSVERNHLFSINLDETTLFGEIDLYALDYSKKLIVATEIKSIWIPETQLTAYHQLIKDLFYFKRNYPQFDLILMYAYGEENKKGYVCERFKKNEIKDNLNKFKNNLNQKKSNSKKPK
jgi:hypothetical protein